MAHIKDVNLVDEKEGAKVLELTLVTDNNKEYDYGGIINKERKILTLIPIKHDYKLSMSEEIKIKVELMKFAQKFE